MFINNVLFQNKKTTFTPIWIILPGRKLQKIVQIKKYLDSSIL